MQTETTPASIEIVEVAPRDGLQNEAMVLPAGDRAALIERAVLAGTRRIEAASFVNPERVPQMKDAEKVMAAVPRRPGVRYSGLVLNERGFARAVAAGCDEVTFVIVASETLSCRNQGVGIAEAIGAWRKVADAAHGSGMPVTVMIAAAFGCPFEGEVPPERVQCIVATALANDPAELAFADTIGCGVPCQVRDLVARVRERAPAQRLRFHFHDTRRTGIANAAAAIEAGAAALDASIGGFGGCPFAPGATGNIATEDLLYLLARSGAATTINCEATLATANWLGGLLGKPPASALARAGGFPLARR